MLLDFNRKKGNLSDFLIQKRYIEFFLYNNNGEIIFLAYNLSKVIDRSNKIY